DLLSLNRLNLCQQPVGGGCNPIMRSASRHGEEMMFKASRNRRFCTVHTLACASIGLALILSSPLSAKADEVWKVHGKLLGEAKKSTGEPKKSTDASGIACAPATDLPHVCLVVDDQTQGVQIVMLQKDSLVAGDFIRLSTSTFDGEPLDIDGEGV